MGRGWWWRGGGGGEAVAVSDRSHRERRREEKKPDEEVGCSPFLSGRHSWHSCRKGAGMKTGGVGGLGGMC